MHASARHPLGAIDHAWLRMDRADNPMMITGVLTFDEPVDLERLRRTVDARLAPFPRFRQRVVRRAVGRRAEWEDAPDYRIDHHVGHARLPPPADRSTLRREIARLVSTPLSLDRPLWRLDLLENPDDGRTVLVARLHHCIGDGFALMHVMLTLTDLEPDPSVPVPSAASDDEAPEGERSVSGDGAEGDGLAGARSPAGVRDRARWMARAAAHAVRRITAPGELARGALAVGRDLVRLATLSGQPDTVLRGPLGQDKRVAWSAPIPLDDVKALAHALDGTVNDVLMSAAAGALARYLREQGEDPSGFDLRTVVPVNLRSPEQMGELGNYFGLVFLELPLGVAVARPRFDELKRRMDALKRSPEPLVLLQVMRLAGAGPRWLEAIIVRILGAKSTAVLTNVPGPGEPRYLAGRRIRTIMFWVPQSGRVGLGVSIFSYAGEVRLGVAVDARRVPDPDRILDGFGDELEALRSESVGGSDRNH